MEGGDISCAHFFGFAKFPLAKEKPERKSQAPNLNKPETKSQKEPYSQEEDRHLRTPDQGSEETDEALKIDHFFDFSLSSKLIL